MGIIDNNLSLRYRNKMLIGVWEDEDKLMETAHALKDAGIKVQDIYTPYPVHGLDRVIGVRRSNLSIVAFLCGLTGFSLAVLMIWYMYIYDWPMDIGNKPVKFTPSWIPVMFESTVLCTAFGMAFFFFWRNRMVHGIKPELLDVRQTDDYLIVAVETPTTDEYNKVKSIFDSHSPVEIRERVEGIQTVIGKGSSPKAESPKSVEPSKEEILSTLAAIVGAASDHKDDLKTINGIDESIESQLNTLGINSYEQISKLDAKATAILESLINGISGKINGDNWKAQSLELLNKEGE